MITHPSGGGSQRIAQAIAEAAVARGWGSVVAYWSGSPPASPARYLKIAAPWPLGLAATLRRLRPDLIQLHGPAAGSIGAAVARLAARAPVLYTDHAPHRDRRVVVRMVRRLTSRLPTMNVAVSGDVARSLTRDAGVDADRVATIVSGVPVADAASRGTAPTFGCVGSLVRIKGHHVLIRALALLADLPEVRIAVVGEGPEREAMTRLAGSLGVADRMSLLGQRADPWTALEGSAGYVHAALAEGGPLTVMEAMMRGYPVATTSVGAVPEIVRDGVTGLVVPPGDAEALAAALRRLAVSPTLRAELGSAARTFALERLTIERCVDQYFAVFARLLR